MSNIITPAESVRLCELERKIQKGKDTFVEVGNALAEIRDSKIYRATFKTFEDYCEKRWEFSRVHAFRLIESAEVSNLLPVGNKPTTERQARELAKAPVEKREKVMEKAQEKAKEEGKPVAARHVEAAVKEAIPEPEPDPLVVDGIEDKPAKTAKAKSPIRKEGMAIFRAAKDLMITIHPDDAECSKALTAMRDYCQARLEINS